MDSKKKITRELYEEMKDKLRIEVDDDLLTNTAKAKLDYLKVFLY